MRKAMMWTDASASAEPTVKDAAELSLSHGAEAVVLLVPPRDLSPEEASSAIEADEERARTYDGTPIVVDRKPVPDTREVLAPDGATDDGDGDGDGEPSVRGGKPMVVRAGSKDPVGAAIRAAQKERAELMVRPQVVDGDADGLDSGPSGSSRLVSSEAMVPALAWDRTVPIALGRGVR